ncbi:C40 family peptidase [Parageobacillus toebii]|uniref:C40 family peptidase n=1 Tax=Parageobacillus toebii TaxID=153151 RepID=UPI0035B53064
MIVNWKPRQIVLTSAFVSALFLMPDDGKAAEWKVGMSSPQIKELQQLLKEKGFFTYPTATGYFGTITEQAVKAFQASVRLPVTGIVDDATYAKLKETAASTAEMKIGSRGNNVKVLQQNLKLLGYFTYPEITGYYGTMTADAVRKFQKQYRLPVTGKADRATLEKINEAIVSSKPQPSAPKAGINLTIGSTGSKVKEVQTKLKQLGYFTSQITGYYGTITANAVKNFQRDVNLKATGVVDAETYERLMGKAPQRKLDVTELVADAAELLGKPYVWGGQTPQIGFDCSGFIVYLFQKQGISLPRTVAAIWSVGTPVSSPSVGDIVFFETGKSGPSHAGIYIGNRQFVHSGSSTGVTISSLDNSYWKARYLGAKRY